LKIDNQKAPDDATGCPSTAPLLQQDLAAAVGAASNAAALSDLFSPSSLINYC